MEKRVRRVRRAPVVVWEVNSAETAVCRSRERSLARSGFGGWSDELAVVVAVVVYGRPSLLLLLGRLAAGGIMARGRWDGLGMGWDGMGWLEWLWVCD